MTILVTTPNGKVGSNVVKLLLERGETVRVAAHTVAKAQAAFPGTEVVQFDYNDPASVAAALRGVDALYLASNGDASADVVINAIDAAKAAGVKRIVHLGAMGADMPEAPLRQRELHIEASGLEWTFLRPTWFMQNYLVSVQPDGVIIEPSADGKTGFIDTRDIAAVAVAALTEDGHNGKIYTLTGGEVLDRHQVAAAIAKATGREIKFVPVSDDQFREAMKAYIPADYLEFLIMIYGAVRAGYTAVTTPDVEQVLGRKPYTIEQFANDFRDAWLPVEAK